MIIYKASCSVHWVCLAFWSPFYPLSCWHKLMHACVWTSLWSLLSTSSWGHCSIGLPASQSVAFSCLYSGDALLSDLAVCLWPWERWKTATTAATVPRIQTHSNLRLKTITLVAKGNKNRGRWQKMVLFLLLLFHSFNYLKWKSSLINELTLNKPKEKNCS